MYNSLKQQDNANCIRACQISILFTCIIYTSIALLGIFFFGSIIEENVLKNVGKEEKNWESLTLRIIFQIVLACHIPFIFFTGKESTLIMVDEFDRRSVSKALMEKIMDRGQERSESDQHLFVAGGLEFPNRLESLNTSGPQIDNVLQEDAQQ